MNLVAKPINGIRRKLSARYNNLSWPARDQTKRARFARLIRNAPGLAVHVIDPGNTGDLFCAPYRHIDFMRSFLPVDIRDCTEWSDFAGKVIIVGGGGLFSPFFESWLKILAQAPGARLICWGAGHNVHDTTTIEPHPLLEQFELVGIRDFGIGHEWVPCVSCMDPLFDRQYEVTHDVIAYDHFAHPIQGLDSSIPRLANDCPDFEQVIKFLGSADLVLTRTYHGAYWATLLGKKVLILDPFSNRFFGYKHQHVICSHINWHEHRSQARSFPEALAECRAANVAFAEKVQSLLELRV